MIFGNEPNLVEDVGYEDHLGGSDHIAITFSINFMCNMNKSTVREIHKYDKMDDKKFKELMNINWEELLKEKGIDQQYELFMSIYEEAVKQCVPTVKFDPEKSSNYNKPMWMSRNTLKLVKHKHQSWVKYKNTKQLQDFQRYKYMRNQVTHGIRKDRRNFENKLAMETKSNNKVFWKYVNSKRQV